MATGEPADFAFWLEIVETDYADDCCSALIGWCGSRLLLVFSGVLEARRRGDSVEQSAGAVWVLKRAQMGDGVCALRVGMGRSCGSSEAAITS